MQNQNVDTNCTNFREFKKQETRFLTTDSHESTRIWREAPIRKGFEIMMILAVTHACDETRRYSDAFLLTGRGCGGGGLKDIADVNRTAGAGEPNVGAWLVPKPQAAVRGKSICSLPSVYKGHPI